MKLDAPAIPPTVEDTPDGLLVTMRTPRVGCIAVFLGVWLTGWAVGEVEALRSLFRMGFVLNPASLFLLLWLAGWTAGGLFSATALAFVLDGSETLLVGAETITRGASAFGRSITWRHPLAGATNLRPYAGDDGVRDRLAFDSGGRTVTLGTGLNETEALRVAEEVWRRHPALRPLHADASPAERPAYAAAPEPAPEPPRSG